MFPFPNFGTILVRTILLLCVNGLSSLLYFIGNYILAADAAKVILKQQNRKAFGQIFGLLIATKYIFDSIVISMISFVNFEDNKIAETIFNIGICIIIILAIMTQIR